MTGGEYAFVASLKEYITEKAAAVDEALDRFLPPEAGKPATLHRAMRYSVFAGGKRVRAVLVLMVNELLGGRVENALPSACAVELVHTYSLIHDDLPAMDDDDLRRGKPTSHKVFGEAVAILAGDALLTLAFELIAAQTGDKALANEMTFTLARAAGPGGMVGGQVVDIESAGTPGDRETLEMMHRMKTAALIRASARMGALSANADDEMIETLSDYGLKIGLAFQVADDLLDAEGTSEELGKTAGKDEAQSKLTYPLLYGAERSKEIARTLAREAKERIARFGDEAKRLRELADFIVERKK